MREIKFIAWLPHSKKMTYAHTLEELINWDTKPEDNGAIIWRQFTGRKDKNDKDIYEGDIVTCHHASSDHSFKHTGVIVFHDGAFMLKCFAYRKKVAGNVDKEYNEYVYLECWLNAESTEIIGNIYQNPELINH